MGGGGRGGLGAPLFDGRFSEGFGGFRKTKILEALGSPGAFGGFRRFSEVFGDYRFSGAPKRVLPEMGRPSSFAAWDADLADGTGHA